MKNLINEIKSLTKNLYASDLSQREVRQLDSEEKCIELKSILLSALREEKELKRLGGSLLANV